MIKKITKFHEIRYRITHIIIIYVYIRVMYTMFMYTYILIIISNASLYIIINIS